MGMRTPCVIVVATKPSHANLVDTTIRTPLHSRPVDRLTLADAFALSQARQASPNDRSHHVKIGMMVHVLTGSQQGLTGARGECWGIMENTP